MMMLWGGYNHGWKLWFLGYIPMKLAKLEAANGPLESGSVVLISSLLKSTIPVFESLMYYSQIGLLQWVWCQFKRVTLTVNNVHNINKKWNIFQRKAPQICSASQPAWIGDGYCDDELNNAGCLFDGGDCCTSDRPDFKTYCRICKCI